MQYLGLGHFTFLDHAPVDLIRLARGAGFGFVGLRFHPFAPGQQHYLPDAQGLREMQTVCAGEGIGVYDIETVVVDAGLNPQSLAPVFAAAQTLGAQRLNLCADDWDRAELVAKLALIAEMAKDAGMGIDLEPMAWRGIDSLAKCAAVLAATGATNAGVLIDALHTFRCGGTAAEVAAIPRPLIRSAQLCDAPLAPPEDGIAEARGGRLAPGAGELPLTNLIAALPAHTILSIEIPQAGATLPAAARAAALFKATQPFLPNGVTA